MFIIFILNRVVTMNVVYSNNDCSSFFQQIYFEIKDAPKTSALQTVLYALPIIGEIGKLCELSYRFSEGFDGFEQRAVNKAGLLKKDFTKVEFNQALLREARRRQAGDVLYLVAKVIPVVVFSGALTLASGTSGVLILLYLMLFVIMVLQAQVDYYDASRHTLLILSKPK